MGLRSQLIDPRSPDRRPRRVAYALPTLFTAGNIFLGYLSILRAFRGAMAAAAGAGGAPEHFAVAAKAIVAAGVLDGLDGRIARMTNTTSEFGREMDSLADVVSFGMAPAVLAYAWGVQFVDTSIGPNWREHILRAGYFVAFLFLLCGAARLARFNIQKNPIPKNPGRPDRKYFVASPFRPPPAWSPPWSSPSIPNRSPGLPSPSPGWRCSLGSACSWSAHGAITVSRVLP